MYQSLFVKSAFCQIQTNGISLKRCCRQCFYLRFHWSSSAFKASGIPSRAVRASRICPGNVLFVAWGHEGRSYPKPEETCIDVRSLRLTIQQLRSKAWVLHEPFRAFSRVANTRLCPQLPEFLLGHPFDFVLHFTLRFPCESPRWRFLVWAGVEKEMQREAACAAHLPPAMAGRAGGGTRSPSHAISCSRPLLRCHFGQGDGSGGAQSRFWNSSTSRASLIPWNCARILQKGFMRIFFKMFVFKILIKERQGVQLLAHCCAGLMKDQHVDTQAF